MTDITELAQSLKAEAEKANEHGEFNMAMHTVHVLALVEALEKAQQVDEELCKLLPPGVEYMDPPDGGDVTPLEGVRRMVADYRQRIAELESRAVTVKLPDYRHERFWDSRCEEFNPVEYQAACIEMWREEIIAQGIKVEAE
jgi:hypothetical protein